jgi:transposase
VTLRKLRRKGGALWRAYGLKEALRGIFAADLDVAEVSLLLDRFCSRASRSGLKPFVTLAKTIRTRRVGILAAIRLGINHAQHEGLNRRVRLIINRAYGFPLGTGSPGPGDALSGAHHPRAPAREE